MIYLKDWKRKKILKHPRILSKACIQIQERYCKLYSQVKNKRIQHHQINITTKPKGTSLGRKEKDTSRIKKITNGEDQQ